MFLINLPVVAAALVAVPLLVAPGGRRADRHLDPPGMVLAAVTLGAAVFAVIDLGHHGVRPPSVVALLVAVGVAIGLAVQERRAPEPMLPLDLLRRPSFAGPNLARAR